MPNGYPILLNVSDKRIVVVGGGGVALRKATKLVEAGAMDVTVVSPQFVDGFPDLVRRIDEVYRPQHLDGAALVFAATDSPSVNAAIVEEAKRRNVWVSRADDDGGDFTAGAVLRKGAAAVCVWADSPALSAAIRDKLSQRWDERWTAMADAMCHLRPLILSSDLPPERRRKLLRELAGDEAMEKLAGGGIDELKKWIETNG